MADEDEESEYEDYDEYNLPVDEPVMDHVGRRLAKRVTSGIAFGDSRNKITSGATPITMGMNTGNDDVTKVGKVKSENRGTTKSSVSKHSSNGKASKGAMKNTQGTTQNKQTSKSLFWL